MSHTTKIPPAKYATSDLPTDVAVGTIVFDETTSEHKSFNGSSWEAIEGGGIGTQTIVFDSTGPSYDQIQGDIPASWKQNDSSLRGLVIGTSCTSIGSNAFYYCGGLTGDLVIPDSVTTIGDYAFNMGFSSDSWSGPLTIGNSVTSIGSYAFRYCTGLTGSLTIPDSVTTIGSYAFYYCQGFNGSLTIGNSVTTIGSYSFGFCTGLTSLTIGNSVTHIETNAFYNCSALTGDLVIPDSVTSIGSFAFAYCSSITALYTNTPAASWFETDALNGTTALVNIYYGPNTNDGAGYSATFQGGSGMTVSAWTNYPVTP